MITITELDKSEALRYLGYNGQAIEPGLSAIIDDGAKECLESARPAYTYQVFDLSFSDAGVQVGNSGLYLEGKDIYSHLHGCKKIAVMAVTLGAGFDHRLSVLQTTDTTKSLIFNSCGSALVEQVCDAVQEEILNKSGLNAHSFRFSPGYGDLPLSAQQIIFRLLLPEKKAGITLTPSNLLVPIKSVTAVLGLGEAKKEISTDKCSICSLRDTCLLRKGGNTCDNPRTVKK